PGATDFDPALFIWCPAESRNGHQCAASGGQDNGKCKRGRGTRAEGSTRPSGGCGSEKTRDRNGLRPYPEGASRPKHTLERNGHAGKCYCSFPAAVESSRAPCRPRPPQPS